MTREKIYRAIDSEREYQDQRWPGHKHSITEYLVYIRDYVEEALHRGSREDDSNIKQVQTDSLRKIAGLAVAAMEEHEVTDRHKSTYVKYGD
jgi:hypothetical protein